VRDLVAFWPFFDRPVKAFLHLILKAIPRLIGELDEELMPAIAARDKFATLFSNLPDCFGKMVSNPPRQAYIDFLIFHDAVCNVRKRLAAKPSHRRHSAFKLIHTRLVAGDDRQGSAVANEDPDWRHFRYMSATLMLWKSAQVFWKYSLSARSGSCFWDTTRQELTIQFRTSIEGKA